MRVYKWTSRRFSEMRTFGYDGLRKTKLNLRNCFQSRCVYLCLHARQLVRSFLTIITISCELYEHEQENYRSSSRLKKPHIYELESVMQSSL